MPNLTTSFPKQTGDSEKDIKRLYNWAVSLTDELKALLCNLDSGNVTEAAKVQASNIDCSKAKIKDAQVQSLTADKLTAGTIDTGEITVGTESETGKVQISGESIIFTEMQSDGSEVMRIGLGKTDTGKFIFTVQSSDKTRGIYMDENGDISISGQAVIGTSIEVGYGADPAVKFIKTSGSIGAMIYFDDSQDALIIKANNIKLDGAIVPSE